MKDFHPLPIDEKNLPSCQLLKVFRCFCKVPNTHGAVIPFDNFLPVSDGFCCLLITFANILALDQARQYVGLEFGPNCLTLIV